MLALALGIGIFSYTLFALGLLGLFNIPVFIFLLFTFLIFSIVLILKYGLIEKMKLIAIYIFTSKSNLLKLLISFLAAMLLINFIIALSPERGFDALWYHLMIPKLYVQNHGVFYIPGSLLYYSPMPKLLDLLYIIPIGLHLDFLTRLISLSFGILTLFTTYYFAKIFVRRSLAILVPVILFSNIVFSWQMTTAYIDIGRTFFEILSIFTLFLWMQNKKQSLFIESALCMGFAISTKPLSFISLFLIFFPPPPRHSNGYTHTLSLSLSFYFFLSLSHTHTHFTFSTRHSNSYFLARREERERHDDRVNVFFKGCQKA